MNATESPPRPVHVPRIKIHLLRLLFALMAVFLGMDAWKHLLTFQGEWDPAATAAWSIWASYSLLAIPGIFYPLKMLPLVMLEILYKPIWLVVVAYPLWSQGQLDGSPAEQMTYNFLWVALPIAAMPWKYAVNTYLKPRRAADARSTCQVRRESETRPRRPYRRATRLQDGLTGTTERPASSRAHCPILIVRGRTVRPSRLQGQHRGGSHER